MVGTPGGGVVVDMQSRAGQALRVETARARSNVALLVILCGGTLLAPWCSVVMAADAPAVASQPLERIVIRPMEGEQRELLARILVVAEDGGLLAQTADGAIWPVDTPELVSREKTEGTFLPENGHAVARRLLGERGPGWQVFETKHYVVCTQSSRAYAEWCAALFERLFFAFENFWKQRDLPLVEPEFPLVALIFENEAAFIAYGRSLGHDLTGAVGFYDVKSNRIAFYDLVSGGDRDIARQMQAATHQVATIIHEATHQIAFNSGLHTRLADNPLWLTEGMAMYFETPDLKTEKGWKTVGAVNELRLPELKRSLQAAGPGSLERLISSDELFTSPETQATAYAQAWGLSYHLIKTRGKDYARYLRVIGAKQRLEWDTPETRRADFKAAFGDDLSRFEKDWLKAMSRLRGK
jgi:hypothetical protein